MKEIKYKCECCNREFDEEEFKLTKNENRCILHCPKETIKNHNKVIKFFWKEVRRKLISDDLKMNLTYLAFPAFEEFKFNEKNELVEDSNFLFKENLKIINYEIDFSKSIFFSSLDFENLEFKNLIFNNCTFKKNISIKNITSDNDISFKESNFDDNVLSNIRCRNNISFEKSRIHNRFIIDNLEECNQINLSRIIFNKSSEVQIRRIKCNDLKISEIFNQAQNISLLDIEIFKSLSLHFSNLNNFIFNNVNLNKADLSFYEISVKDTIFSSVTWGDLFRKKFEFKTRDIVREFKYSLEYQGNIIEANRFYALEMKERDKELKWKTDFFEKLIFKFHGISSNHSQNWLLALFWILVIGMLSSTIDFFYFSNEPCIVYDFSITNLSLVYTGIFIFYYLIATYFDGNYFKTTLSLFAIIPVYWYLTRDFLFCNFSKTINPFSIMKSAEDINIIQLFFKIIIAYLIYQLIISIRQNTRRK